MAAAAPANADNGSCFYTPPSQLLPIAIVGASITPHPAGFATHLYAPDGDITVTADNGAIDCGAGTVTNTDLISIADGSPGGNASLLPVYIPVGSTARFAPGANNEAGSSDEIEFGVGLGPGHDTLAFDGNYGGRLTMRLGADKQAHINLNAAEQTGVDSDMTVTGADVLIYADFYTGAHNDEILGTGGLGTGSAPFPAPIEAIGFLGDDHLAGGAAGDDLCGDCGTDQGGGADTLEGEAGDDNLTGDVGNDVLRGGEGRDILGSSLISEDGDDLLDGGPGRDSLDGGAGVDTLLGAGGLDEIKGGLDDDLLRGARGNDRLAGEIGRDRIFGGPGRDRIAAGPGDDTARGGKGRDRIRGGPGRDLLVGGPGFDACFGGPNPDLFLGCELIKQ